MRVDKRCQFCGVEGEDINHVLFTCSVARQVWALSLFPVPENGFSQTSLYANIDYVLTLGKNLEVQKEVRQSFPWIMWVLWKNRNKFSIEGKSFMPLETLTKIRDDVEEWFLAQQVDREEDVSVNVHNGVRRKQWKPPPVLWYKCNIGTAWSKEKKLAGASWAVRDFSGRVKWHSRRAFGNYNSWAEAYLTAFLWAAESMLSHRVSKVVISLEESYLVKAINRPKAWPSFRYQLSEMRKVLSPLFYWKVELEVRATNRGPYLIAQSVTKDDRCHSYVQSGHPHWLHDIFVSEMVSASV